MLLSVGFLFAAHTVSPLIDQSSFYFKDTAFEPDTIDNLEPGDLERLVDHNFMTIPQIAASKIKGIMSEAFWKAIQKKVKLDAVDPNHPYLPAIAIAARDGNFELFSLLKRLGANINYVAPDVPNWPYSGKSLRALVEEFKKQHETRDDDSRTATSNFDQILRALPSEDNS